MTVSGAVLRVDQPVVLEAAEEYGIGGGIHEPARAAGAREAQAAAIVRGGVMAQIAEAGPGLTPEEGAVPRPAGEPRRQDDGAFRVHEGLTGSAWLRVSAIRRAER